MPLIPITPLHTSRLTVRGVTTADLPELLPINADDRVTHHLPYAPWQSMADAEAWLSRVEGLLRDEWLAASQTPSSAI